jgi:hypothetical protein
MRTDESEYDVFEAVCGVQGDFELGGLCGEEAPPSVDPQRRELPCTRRIGHAGDHVAGHANGWAICRWPGDLC